MTKKRKAKKPLTMPQAFNEWMKRYTKNPEMFNREFEEIGKFLKESKLGKEPSYGDVCAKYLINLVG